MTAPRYPAPPSPPPWHPDLTTVGVTGTNGKTSTSLMVAAALATGGRPVPCTTTLGSFLIEANGRAPLDVPLTYAGFIETMRRGHAGGGQYAVAEMTSEALMRGFAVAWPCRVAIFTNLTHDHLDAHQNPEHYLASKAQLFLNLPSEGTAILNADDDASALLASVVAPSARVWRYGASTSADELTVRLDSVVPGWHGTDIALSSSVLAAPKAWSIRAIGAHFAENAVAAWLGACAAGVDSMIAAEAIAALSAPSGRFEVVADAPHVIVDYAHTPDAIARTLRCAKQLAKGRVTVVFGAGGERDKGKRPSMGQAAMSADRIIITSDNPRSEDPAAIAADICSGIDHHADLRVQLERDEAIGAAISDAASEDVVLVLGRGHESSGGLHAFSDAEIIRRYV